MLYSKQEINGFFEAEPVVAAVKSEEGLEACLKQDCSVVFLLYGNICNVTDIVSRLKKSGKAVIVHIDLIEGLASKEISVRFLRENTEADGVISTKSQMIKAGKELGFYTVQRFFMLDSMSLEGMVKQFHSVGADVIEILPAVNPRIIKRLATECRAPLIVGGLITQKEDIIQMLGAGASAVSTTKPDLWGL